MVVVVEDGGGRGGVGGGKEPAGGELVASVEVVEMVGGDSWSRSRTKDDVVECASVGERRKVREEGGRHRHVVVV